MNLAEIYHRPLLDLVFEAARVHRAHHDPRAVQCSTLLSIKTGACPEDCGYCAQSAHHATGLERERLLPLEEVVAAARRAREGGAGRFCMGAAWRQVRDDADFERVLEMVQAVRALGLETCGTFGMLTEAQARRLKEAGLDYYNHNLDTSPDYYPKVVTTRTYQERLDTLAAARGAGLKLCSGGILGMGESEADRIALLEALASQDPPPESVPINALVPVEGTPLAKSPPLPWDALVRTVATARIAMPRSVIRLAAGRTALDEATQALCFLAGAGSIFLGERLLTTPNRAEAEDRALLERLGLRPVPAPETGEAVAAGSAAAGEPGLARRA